MYQEDLRNNLKHIHEKYYVPYSRIASDIGVSGAFISLFVSGKRNISDETADKLTLLLN